MNSEERDKKNQMTKLNNQVKIPDPNLNLQSNSKHRRTNSTSSNLSVVDLNDSDKDNWNFFTSTQNLGRFILN